MKLMAGLRVQGLGRKGPDTNRGFTIYPQDIWVNLGHNRGIIKGRSRVCGGLSRLKVQSSGSPGLGLSINLYRAPKPTLVKSKPFK